MRRQRPGGQEQKTCICSKTEMVQGHHLHCSGQWLRGIHSSSPIAGDNSYSVAPVLHNSSETDTCTPDLGSGPLTLDLCGSTACLAFDRPVDVLSRHNCPGVSERRAPLSSGVSKRSHQVRHAEVSAVVAVACSLVYGFVPVGCWDAGRF